MGIEPLDLLLQRHLRQIIFLHRMQRDQRLPIAFRQREITDERFIRAAVEAIARNVVRHRAARIAAHHFVDAEVLAIEVNPAAQVQIRVEGGVKRLLQPIDIDAELAQQPHRHRAEVERGDCSDSLPP